VRGARSISNADWKRSSGESCIARITERSEQHPNLWLSPHLGALAQRRSALDQAQARVWPDAHAGRDGHAAFGRATAARPKEAQSGRGERHALGEGWDACFRWRGRPGAADGGERLSRARAERLRGGARWTRTGSRACAGDGLSGPLRHRVTNCAEAQPILTPWLRWYNAERPHPALGYLSPREYRRVKAGGDPQPPDMRLRSEQLGRAADK